MFPLGKFHAQISTNSFINNVALTATHSLSDAIQAKIEQSGDKINIAKKIDLDEKDIDLSIFSKISTKNAEAEKIKPNVIFIVWESCSSDVFIHTQKKLKKEFNANIAACHMDIAPTLYDLSLSEVEYTAAGISMLDQDKKHIAFNSNGFILSGDKAVLFNVENGEILYFNFDSKSKMLSITEQTDEHKFMLEYYKKIICASDMYINQK